MRPVSLRPAIVVDDAADFAALDSVSNADSPDVEGFLSAEELRGLRQEKLATIRESIANGDYDSDKLLDIALSRMLETLNSSPESETQSTLEVPGE